ncbi:MAG: hypothetical protein WDN00_08045 [Limisphaerales bacterium]
MFDLVGFGWLVLLWLTACWVKSYRPSDILWLCCSCISVVMNAIKHVAGSSGFQFSSTKKIEHPSNEQARQPSLLAMAMISWMATMELRDGDEVSRRTAGRLVKRQWNFTIHLAILRTSSFNSQSIGGIPES